MRIHTLVSVSSPFPNLIPAFFLRTMTALGIAIVTGAGQGIGRAIALRLADDGFDVAINDIQSNRANLEGVEAEIVAKGRRTALVLADVTNEEEVKGMIDQVVRELGGLDVVRVPLTRMSQCLMVVGV